MAGRNGKDPRAREHLVHEAARIMAEEQITDFLAAKRKAALRLGLDPHRHLPGNDEIERALVEYQRLFLADTQPAALKTLREHAAEAMELLHDFSPRLTGAVLRGTADAHSEVTLHLFADAAEDVAIFLMDRHIPFEHDEQRVGYNNGRDELCPVYRFLAGDTPIALMVFPPKCLRQAPRSPVDGRPMARANLTEVRALLENN